MVRAVMAVKVVRAVKVVKVVMAVKVVRAIRVVRVVRAIKVTVDSTTHPVYQATLAHSTGRTAPNRFAPRSKPEDTIPMSSAVFKTPMP
jgi:hypothetical protein